MLIVQLVEEVPAGTTTALGIEAMAEAPLTIPSVTVVLTAAGAFKVTRPVVLIPPTTEDGEMPRVESTGAVNVTVLEAL